jgi:hypothetical protein
MDGSTLYDEDVCAWAEHQAAALRRLAASRRDLPNDLDWENIAEEIEDVGNAQRRAAESAVRQLFVHLIKLAAAPQVQPARHWRGEIGRFHNDLLAALTPSMPSRIDLDLAWKRAMREAQGRLTEEEMQTGHALFVWMKLRGCPYTFDDLSSETFDIDGALSRFPERT